MTASVSATLGRTATPTVLALDPGLRHTGLAWIHGAEVVTTTLRAAKRLPPWGAIRLQCTALVAVAIQLGDRVRFDLATAALELPATEGIYARRRGAVRGRGTGFAARDLLWNARLTGALAATLLRFLEPEAVVLMRADRLSKERRAQLLIRGPGGAAPQNEHERDALWLAHRLAARRLAATTKEGCR